VLRGLKGHLPEGASQEWAAAFGDLAMRLLVRARLKDVRIQADEGDELFGRFEVINRIEFAEETHGGDGCNPRQGQQPVRKRCRFGFDFFLQIGFDFFQGFELIEQQTNIDAKAFKATLHSDGAFSGEEDFLRFDRTVFASRCFPDELGEFIFRQS